jgi:hypothetical protein
VLDHVQRRRFLVQPAGEDALHFFVGALDVDLDERAGQLFFLPRGGGLAGAQAHEQILPARGLAGVQRDVFDDAVALVEDAEHRDALGHRRNSRRAHPLRDGGVSGRPLPLRFLLAAAARGERQRDQERCGCLKHAYSGIQGS